MCRAVNEGAISASLVRYPPLSRLLSRKGRSSLGEARVKQPHMRGTREKKRRRKGKEKGGGEGERGGGKVYN